MKKLLIIFFFLTLVFSPLAASAQWGAAKINLDTVAGPTGLNPDFEGTVSTVIKAALSLLGTIFLILMVYAGILWMTAQGNDDRVTKAKDIIKAAIIGLVVVMAAYAITSFVTGKLSGSGGSSSGGGSGVSGGNSLPITPAAPQSDPLPTLLTVDECNNKKGLCLFDLTCKEIPTLSGASLGDCQSANDPDTDTISPRKCCALK